MALTPEQVAEQGKPAAARMQEIEANIDLALVTMKRSGYWHGIPLDDYNQAECDWILSAYRAAGWSVSIYNGRDGSYISFVKA